MSVVGGNTRRSNAVLSPWTGRRQLTQAGEQAALFYPPLYCVLALPKQEPGLQPPG